MDSLDAFYLVEVIRDQKKFGYDDATVRYARRVLKRRGFTKKDLDEIYDEKVKPLDDLVRRKAVALYFSFLRLGRRTIYFYSGATLLLFFLIMNQALQERFPGFFAGMIMGLGIFLILLPFFCMSRVRRIIRLILDRYDDRPSQELLHKLDDNTWLMLGWYLFIPGYLISFYRTREQLSSILTHLGFFEER